MRKLIFIQPLLFLLFSACTSHPILTSKITVRPEEQKRLVGAVDRKSNYQLYESNLTKVWHPKQNELFREANIKNSAIFDQNYEVLVDWYLNKLSKHERKQLSSNCGTLVGHFSEKFPLTEKSLPCAGWWLDQKANERQISATQDRSRRSKSSKIILSKTDRMKWQKYKHLTLQDAANNINTADFDQITTLAKKAVIVAQNCSYKEANAALIFKLEEFLPKVEAYKSIEKIYQKSSHCYKPNETVSERVNLRMGVLGLIHGNYTQAVHAFKKTQLEKEPQDSNRSLFWLGVIEAKKNKNEETNSYWEKLTRENPIGFLSVVANHKMNRDPMDLFVADDSVNVQNRISGGWNEHNLQAFLFDLFYIRQDTLVLQSLSRSVARHASTIHKQLYLYWAINHNIAHNYRGSIVVLNKYFDAQKGRHLTLTMLKLNFPIHFSEEILDTSKKVDPLLVLALIRQESVFDPTAHSSANAHGLMQLLPSTARDMEHGVSTKKLFEPKTNIKLGIMYLEKLLEKYDGRIELALAAYNAGPNRVDIWTERIPSSSSLLFMEYMPFKETRNYVSTIMRNHYWYKRLMSEQSNDQISSLYLEKTLTSIWKPANFAQLK